MTLVDALNKNGTGILKGICVPEDRIFDQYLSDQSKIIKKIEEKGGKFKVKFSLNEKYLGEYTLELEDYGEYFISGLVVLKNSKHKIFIEMTIENLGDYGNFTAFLRQ